MGRRNACTQKVYYCSEKGHNIRQEPCKKKHQGDNASQLCRVVITGWDVDLVNDEGSLPSNPTIEDVFGGWLGLGLVQIYHESMPPRFIQTILKTQKQLQLLRLRQKQ